MKILVLSILLTFATTSFAMPGFSNNMSNCHLSLYHFCDNLEDNSANLCPKKLSPKFKDICIVNNNQKIDLLNSCKNEIQNFCKDVKKPDFLFLYNCIANPKNWANYSKNCLGALSSPHHSSSQNTKI